MTQQVSVIIPTLNEAANLRPVIQGVAEALADARLTFEIIVVDDASTDGTVEVARELATRSPVRLTERHGATGLSTPIVAGMRRRGEKFSRCWTPTSPSAVVACQVAQWRTPWTPEDVEMTQRNGMSLVELLVVASLIGIIIAISLPAVATCREAARRSQCQRNVREAARAAILHELAQGHYPTSGWTYTWVGDPDRGFKGAQPGGWVYNVLPYLDEMSLRRIGANQQSAKRRALATLTVTPIPGLTCPSRGGNPLGNYRAERPPRNALHVEMVARADFAANAGDLEYGGLGQGPETLDEGDATYRWEDDSLATGVSYQRSKVRPTYILDGVSHTYLLGEKHTSLGNGVDDGHDQSMYTGYDFDTCRWTTDRPAVDGRGGPHDFGSAHATGCHMAFVDGAVRLVSYDISFVVHKSAGNRADNTR